METFCVKYEPETVTFEYSKSFFLFYFIAPFLNSILDLDFKNTWKISTIIIEFILNNSFKFASYIVLTFITNDMFFYVLNNY